MDILPLYLGIFTHMASSIKSKIGVVKEGKTAASKSHQNELGLTRGLSHSEMTWKLLGGRHFMAHKPKTSLEFYGAVRRGVPKLSIDFLAQVMNIPMTKMAILLNLSYKTLTRKNKVDLLDTPVSSHAFEIAETIAKGLGVFEDKERLNRWLNKENRALNGAKPYDLLDTSTGIKLVNQILGRIEEGVYS
jgi:putative toxin-antitoxin system antitoxin component (TIGR02293 family)